MVLKLSVVATSTCMRDGRSARAQTIPESTDTSPDWMPWVMTGRSAARLRYGRAMPSRPVDHRGRAERRQEPAPVQRSSCHGHLRIDVERTVQSDADTMPSFQRQFRDRWIIQSPQREADRHDQIDRMLRHRGGNAGNGCARWHHRQHLLVERRHA